MAKAKRKNKVPRPRAGGQWTESRFFSFIRSALRGASRRWPPLVKDVLMRSRRPYTGLDKRTKFEYECLGCGGWFPAKHINVDHIVPCGTLKTFDDLPGFVERLFCEVDGLRLLCEACHEKRHDDESKEEHDGERQ